MIRFGKDYLRDRIYACWLGKNIGGTIGTPYEGKREVQDVKGFNSKPGEPLPNDDLDLQLVWLRAVNELGADAINSKILGEYWVSWITPHWNEYGVCKANMRDGVLPPMSGEINNEEWKHSNGAWIRTEIWASLYPGMPEKAIRLAYEDASVDHGFGEGTYAAIFVAAMESAAYIIDDFDALLQIGLSKIPEDCRVARAVRLVMKAHADGVSWKECREMVVEDSRDLGWFQAPANVAFCVLGILYAECDFKQSILIAVNCGDDTDCTGATVGALLGIMGGMAVIPEDWRAYIGDEIKSICITNGHGRFPKTCTELTDCVMSLLPSTLRPNNDDVMNGTVKLAIGDANDFSSVKAEDFYGRKFVETLASRKQYSYSIEGIYADVIVNFDDKPAVEPNGTVCGEIVIRAHTMPEQKRYRLSFMAPEGWSVDCAKNLFTPALHSTFTQAASARFTIYAGERVEAANHLVLQVLCAGRPTPILVPIRIAG
ncbi:MAG: ADP-ribosylglycohydrolase family protein [Christensenellales bacterium]|jgi:ADP-ribosylglycohydrolase